MRTLFWASIVLLLVPTVLLADAPPLPTKISTPNAKTMQVGTSELCDFEGITTSGVGNPAVADIVPLSTRCLLINAKAVGQTTVFVLDKAGKHLLRVTVTQPETDLSPIAAKIQTAIALPKVTASAVNETIFLEGSVETTAASERAEAIAGAYASKVKNLLIVRAKTSDAYTGTLAETYATLLNETLAVSGISARILDDTTIALTGKYVAPIAATDSSSPASTTRTGHTQRAKPDIGTEDESQENSATPSSDPLVRLLASLPPRLKVINLINFQSKAPQQVLIKAKVIDIDRNASKDLGIAWGSLHIVDSSASGRTYEFQSQPLLFGQSGDNGALNFNSLLGGGTLKRVLPLAAQINALITENKARILSEPSLMVLDGNEGSLLVGGEIPIPVSQGTTNGGGGNVTVEYKQFGIQLSVLPSVLANGEVQLTVTPEVSDLDYGNAVELNGFSIPALSVRRATSTLQLHDGETLVIGGLYSSQSTKETQRIPLLSQIPVLGEFFKNTSTRKTESELLILIQPEVVTETTADALPPPPGSPQNPPIVRPDVQQEDFDKDFPDLQQDHRSPAPAPVNLPAGPAPGK